MKNFLEYFLDFTRQDKTYLFLFLFIFAILIFKLIINRKFTIFDIVAYVSLIITSILFYYGAEGSVMFTLDSLNGYLDSGLFSILNNLYFFGFLLSLTVNIILLFSKNINVKFFLFKIALIVINFLIIFTFVFHEDILYLKDELYQTDDVNDVIFDIIKDNLLLIIISIVISIFIYCFCKKKRINN